MNIEADSNSLRQLAKDSIGLTAYQWVHDEKPELTPAARTSLGVVLGIREFFAPAVSRFDRESNYESSLQNSITRLTTFPRDALTYLLAMGAFIGTAHLTDIPAPPSSAL